MRVSQADEEVGLDLSQHGESLNPHDADRGHPEPFLKVASR
jgi:hypothetical protein